MLFAFASMIAPAIAGAQDDGPVVISVTGSQGTVTVVESESVTIGGPTPGRLRSGPPRFRCAYGEQVDEFHSVVRVDPVEGVYYWFVCWEVATGDPLGLPQIIPFDPGNITPGVPTTSSLDIRNIVRDSGLVDPQPIAVGRSPEQLQITGIETWLWPDGSVEALDASATGQISGLTVWIETQWNRTVFTMEDGVEIVCDRVTIWSDGVDETDCAHTYLTEYEAVDVSATSYWDFYWRDNAGQPVPVLFETVALIENDVLEVRDLEAVISRR